MVRAVAVFASTAGAALQNSNPQTMSATAVKMTTFENIANSFCNGDVRRGLKLLASTGS